MFDIYLTEEIAPVFKGYALYGRAHLGNYCETFMANLAR
jgi:hypothetical protein